MVYVIQFFFSFEPLWTMFGSTEMCIRDRLKSVEAISKLVRLFGRYSVSTVSYTHLDVYKRQIIIFLVCEPMYVNDPA